ncbi:MAG: hypothetical protein ABW073_04510 [Acidimicrobiia bacterium]
MLADPSSVALVVGGLLAIALAILWRRSARARRLALLEGALSSPDSETRMEAARPVVAQGLDRTAAILLDHVATETDDRVLGAIALAVLERQWEPSGSPRVQKLRWWAGNELERLGFGVKPFPAAFTRLSDMGGPRAPDLREDKKDENAKSEESDDEVPA